MSKDNFNENLVLEIDGIVIEQSSLRLRGWALAEVQISSLRLLLNGNYAKVIPVESFGLESLDVANQYGQRANNCRFSEDIRTDLPLIQSVAIIVEFINGYSVVSTVYDIQIKLQDRSDETLVLGIGVTTYNRPQTLNRLLNKITQHTKTPYVLVVADDGSSDQTIQVLNDHKVPFIAGRNKGIAWNKNRALYYLNSSKKCDVVIMLEDDTSPAVDGWEAAWIEGSMKYDHLNLAGHWFNDRYLSGLGTVDSPVISPVTSGQCVSFSRRALETVGYFDTRFGRYGYEHVEHTERCVKMGYGGFSAGVHSAGPSFLLLKGGVHVGHLTDFSYQSLITQNHQIYVDLQNDETHRWAWRGDSQMNEFLEEQNNIKHA